MKKLKFVFCFILLTFIYIVGGNVNNIYAYTTINSQTLFTPSTFDTLVLNYTTLPTVSVSGSQTYHLGEGTTSSGAPTRGVYYDNASTGQTLDSTVTVNFSNCGTLLGRPIDMKLIYSDIVTNGDGPYLYWSAFGSQMMSSNEWWYQHIEHVDVDVYFYYHGETTPINIDTAYLSIFSEDTNEGSGSSQISEAYLYTTTNMAHVDNRTSVNGSRVYYDVYYGTTSGSTEAGSLNCVSFRYNNKDHLNIELYGLNYGTSIGYHLQYTPLTAVVPSNPVKTVSKTQAQLGDTLTYTVEQQISTRFDDSFHYSSLVFTDIIDKNLTYNSLRVYNENGNDVTSSAGTTSYDSTTQRLTYTFNSGYLQNNMNYNGQSYKFVISANVKHSVNSAIINNSSSVNINNQHELNSNTVTTTLKSKVNVHYVNMQGVKIAEDEVINGNILDPYSTSSKNINGYKLIRDTGNTQGTMTENEINVTYTYDIVRSSIQIDKTIEETDSTQKQNLAGAVFKAEVINFAQGVELAQPDTVYYSTQTDENGHCVIDGLPYGTYKITESTVPDIAYNGKFYLNDGTDVINTFNVEISQESSYEYSIEDVAKKMQIVIYKEDSETGNTTQGDAKLEGAEYTIYRDEQCSDAVETVTIAKNDDGTYSATSGWYMVGTYYVKETKAPEGYLIDNTVYPVVQVPSKQKEEFSTHTVLSKDKVIEGIVKVIKYNNGSSSTDEGPATGAVLRLTLNSNEDIYYEATVNEYGYLEFVDDSCKDTCYPYTIPYGKYTISEVKASDSGAHVFIEEQPTEIVYDKQIQEYILSDEYVRMSLTIEKYDGETGNKIPTGATFKIWDVNNNKWYEEMSYPSGEYISEFTTNSTGSLTLNRHLEAGRYILYETKAPEGYYLDDDLREGSAGYEFTVQVNKAGDVVVTHNGEEQVLEYEMVDYDNVPTKMYKYTAKVNDIPQKAIVEVEKLADQVVGVQEQDTEYGKLNVLQYDKKGLENVTFQLVAAEDIVTPDGTTRYNQGQVVSNIITNNQGIGRSQEVYLGKYLLKETSTQNGYVLNSDPIEINIQYTNQYEKVQIVKQKVENKKQEVNLEFEKIYKQLEESKFKFDETFAVFGVYTKTPMYGYDGSIALGENQLVDILETDENNMLKNNVELPEGEYYVKELYVSNPYGLEDDTYEFKVEYTNTDNQPIEVTVNNGKIENIAQTAELEIIKFSDADYEKLNIEEINDKEKIRILASEYGVEGAVYKVYNDKECTNPVITIDNKEAEFVTDKNGTIKLSDMPYGTYYFKEVEAPYGYELSDEIIEVKINDENSNLGVFIVVNDPLKKADLLQKIDTFTKDVVSGCEFEIYNDDGRMIYSAKTDNNGKVQIPIIYFENGGKYYYKEVSAPKMYQVDEEAKEFIAKYDEEKCEWTLELIEVGNDRKTIEQVILRKTDRETGEPLQGCEFTIVLLDENGEEYVNQYGEKIYLVEKGVTNEEGEYVIKDVPYGTYRFVEIKAPEGYELDEDITGLEFTVDERSGDTLIFEVTNTGDIAVVAIASIAVVSVIGIIYVLKRKKVNSIM